MAFASSPDRVPPNVTSAKIVVAGGFGVGKTTLVSTVSASQFQEIADKFAEVFPNPATIHDFLVDPAKAAAYVESVAAAR